MIAITQIHQVHYEFFKDNGTEATQSTLVAEDTAWSVNVGSAESLSVCLRIKVYDAIGGGLIGESFQLQCSRNGGTYQDVTTSSSIIKAYDSTNLTDGGATTERLTATGTGFTAGLISEDGLVDSITVTGDDATELLYTINVIQGDLANGDTVTFRLLHTGATLNTYEVTPQINVSGIGSSVNRRRVAIKGGLIY